MSGRIILCRHGATSFNADGDDSAELVRGWKDVPLDESGRRDACKLGRSLRRRSVDELANSPLDRAKQTASIVSRYLGIEATTLKGLYPWNVGELAGKQLSVVHDKMLGYIQHPTDSPHDGESFHAFTARFLGCLFALLEYAKATGKTVAAITHKSNTQLAKAWLEEGAHKDMGYDLELMAEYAEPGHGPNDVEPGKALILAPA